MIFSHISHSKRLCWQAGTNLHYIPSNDYPILMHSGGLRFENPIKLYL